MVSTGQKKYYFLGYAQKWLHKAADGLSDYFFQIMIRNTGRTRGHHSYVPSHFVAVDKM